MNYISTFRFAIELEISRLLRSSKFSMALHTFGKTKKPFVPKPREMRVLRGTADIPEKKLLSHSPTTKELVLSDHDHRMLAVGIVEIEP